MLTYNYAFQQNTRQFKVKVGLQVYNFVDMYVRNKKKLHKNYLIPFSQQHTKSLNVERFKQKKSICLASKRPAFKWLNYFFQDRVHLSQHVLSTRPAVFVLRSISSLIYSLICHCPANYPVSLKGRGTLQFTASGFEKYHWFFVNNWVIYLFY